MSALDRREPPAESTSATLSVRDLHASFLIGDGVEVQAVRGVSFDVHRGDKLAIVGESGCGKSTLALAMLGLLEPPGKVTAGEVWLNGKKVDRADEQTMCAIRGAEVGLVVQEPLAALDPVMPIGKQVAEAIRLHDRRVGRSAARRRAVELLREVEIPHPERCVDDYPHQYSGGMRQRVVIAMAVANEPDLLIADEPTTALDVTTQAQVLEMLDRLSDRRGMAVMLITHNLGLVAQFCDVVQVMYAGRVVERSATRTLFRHPAHPYTRALIGAVLNPRELRRDALPAIPGVPPDMSQPLYGCSFARRCPIATDTCRASMPPISISELDGQAVLAECFYPDRDACEAVRWEVDHGTR